jgi:hypothetical protein
MALARNKHTGTVNDATFGPGGLHFKPFWREWIKFDSMAQVIEMNNLQIYTTDNLQVRVSFWLYYFMDPAKLSTFYRNFGSDFESFIGNVAQSHILNFGQQFSIKNYRESRINVKNSMKESLKLLFSNYSLNFFELYMDRLQFQTEINDINLLRVLNTVYNERAINDKTEAMIRQETHTQVSFINHSKDLILETAYAHANYTSIRTAQSESNRILESQHWQLMNHSVTELDFRKVSPKYDQKKLNQLTMSFCYLSAITYNENIIFSQVNKHQILGFREISNNFF